MTVRSLRRMIRRYCYLTALICLIVVYNPTSRNDGICRSAHERQQPGSKGMKATKDGLNVFSADCRPVGQQS